MSNQRIKKRALNPAERDAYMREALGLKKIIRDGKTLWIRDPSDKQPRLQYGAGVTVRPKVRASNSARRLALGYGV